MAVTAKDVKALREATGAGMMDCKKALAESDGDTEKAVEWLREQGLATAQKKAGRAAAEGTTAAVVSEDGKSAVMLEVNCETDFCAGTDEFISYAEALAKQVLNNNYADFDAFLNAKSDFDPSVTVEEYNNVKVGDLHENIKIRRFEKITSDGLIASYIHAKGKVGVLVVSETDASSDNAAVTEALKNVAMQVAAMKPQYNSDDEVPQDYKDGELAILREQVKQDPANAKKPENILEKMVVGRLNKELKEICLQDQEYVKAENKENVAAYIAKVGKDNGVNLKVVKFVRFETGEGLEKKQDNFAEEVAAQANN